MLALNSPVLGLYKYLSLLVKVVVIWPDVVFANNGYKYLAEGREWYDMAFVLILAASVEFVGLAAVYTVIEFWTWNNEKNKSDYGIMFYGTSQYAAEEAMDLLKNEGIEIDALRIKAFPFNKTVEDFINSHERVFVIDQNRDAQMRSLLMIELNADPAKLISVLNYDGMPITADNIMRQVSEKLLIGQE